MFACKNIVCSYENYILYFYKYKQHLIILSHVLAWDDLCTVPTTIKQVSSFSNLLEQKYIDKNFLLKFF